MNKNITPEEKLLKIIKADTSPLNRQKIKTKPNFSFLLNTVLIIFIIFLCAYLIFNIFIKQPQDKEVVLVEKKEDSKELPLQHLTLNIDKDIFAIENQEAKEENLQTSKGQPSEIFINRMLSQFNLVGIIAVNEAIIEDRNTNKTYFVHKGETFLGIKIKDIKEDKVILESNGQEAQLVL
ncbi:MAG: hypothetical protein AB1755_01670 [Candidatus Omnitrophota bacterium]